LAGWRKNPLDFFISSQWIFEVNQTMSRNTPDFYLAGMKFDLLRHMGNGRVLFYRIQTHLHGFDGRIDWRSSLSDQAHQFKSSKINGRMPRGWSF
jgi:hypothetical protein